jgi:KRAB domain-containing zinc finger protein
VGEHIRRVHQDSKKSHVCEDCGKAFLKRFELNLHAATHKPSDQKETFACGDCDRVFLTASNLSRHQHSCGLKDESKHSCQKCGMVFGRSDVLKNHLKISHDHKCLKCGKVFISKISLMRHKKSCKTVVCKTCKKEFRKNFLLKLHEETHKRRSQRKAYACGKCKRQYATKSNLARHLHTCS